MREPHLTERRPTGLGAFTLVAIDALVSLADAMAAAWMDAGAMIAGAAGHPWACKHRA